MPILKETFSGWKAPKAYARIASPFTTETIPSQHKIPTPDKANATYTAGLLFPLRDDDPQSRFREHLRHLVLEAERDPLQVDGEDLNSADEEDVERLKDLASDAPVVRLVNPSKAPAAQLR